MVRQLKYNHNVVVTGSNDGTKQVSKNAWNDGHNELGMFGWGTVTTLTVATGAITPVNSMHKIDGEGASADDLATITNTETAEFDEIWLFSGAQTITVVNSGNMVTLSGLDKVLDTNIPTKFIRVGTSWYEVSGDGLKLNKFSGRQEYNKGVDIASGDAITFGTDGNLFDITGTTTINHFNNTDMQDGTMIILHFDSALTLTHNAGGLAGDEENILLAGDTNYTTNAGDILTFVLHENGWEEISRNALGGGSPLPVADTTSIVEGSADATKELRFEVDGFTTATTRVITPPDADINLAGTNIANTWSADNTFGRIIHTGRHEIDKGADIASATAITLGTDGNTFDITGVTTIDHINNTNWQIGSVVVLHFDGALQLTHNAGGLTGDETNFDLIGDTNYTTSAGDVLTFFLHDATTFIEISRNTQASGAQTPWTSNIDADGFDLTDLSNIEFRTTTGAPAGTVRSIWYDDAEGMGFNALTGDHFRFEINGALEAQLTNTTLDLQDNLITTTGGVTGEQFTVGGNIRTSKGVDVASADAITLTADGNVFDITGVTTINHINNTNWTDGSIVVLHFDGAVQVTHNAGAPAGAEEDIFLQGDTNYTTSAGDILTFALHETGWQEISRNVATSGTQTPWTSNIDADGFDLQDLSNIEFRVTTGAPAGTVPAIYHEATGITLNVPTSDVFNVGVNNSDVFRVETTGFGVAEGYILGLNNISVGSATAFIQTSSTRMKYNVPTGDVHEFHVNDTLEMSLGVNGMVMSTRDQWAKGADVASATEITLGNDGNVFDITGTITITGIVATNWQAGSIVHLQFDGALLLSHNAGSSPDLLMANGASPTTSAGDVFTFFYNGTDWVEISRNSAGEVSTWTTDHNSGNNNLIMGTGFIQFGSDPADVGVLRLSASDSIAWEASPAGTDFQFNHNVNQFQFQDDVVVLETNLSGKFAIDANHTTASDGDLIGTYEFRDTTTVAPAEQVFGAIRTLVQDPANATYEGEMFVSVGEGGSLVDYISFNNAGNNLIDLLKPVIDITYTGREKLDKGADVASATDITLGGDGNVFDITGTTQIDGIATANWQAGSIVTLQFDGALTLNHNAGSAPDLVLAGATNATTSAGDVYQFFFDGTDWVEISRNSGAGGGGSQTPWTSNIDADGFDLQDLSNIEFRVTTGAPAGTVPSIYHEATGITINVPSNDTLNIDVNGSVEYIIGFSEIDFQTNNISNFGHLQFEIGGSAVAVSESGIWATSTGMFHNIPVNDAYFFNVNGTTEYTLDAVAINCNSNNIVGVNDLTVQNSVIMSTATDLWGKGTDIVSADAITITSTGNVFDITGTTTINHINNTDMQDGVVIIFQFDGAVTLTHSAGGAIGDEEDLFLQGDTNYTTSAGDILTFILHETGWQEISRNVAGGGSQTPWTSNIDADGFDLTDLSNIEFRVTTGAPAGTVPAIYHEATGITLNVPDGDTFNIDENGTVEYSFSDTALDMQANNLITTGFIAIGADPADTGSIRLPNGAGGSIAWEASPAGTDGTLQFSTNEIFVFSHSVSLASGANYNLENAGAVTWNLDNNRRIFNDTNGFIFEVPTGDTFDWEINSVSILTWDVTNFDLKGLNITNTNYQDHDVITAPADPAVDHSRVYAKQVDASNDGYFIKQNVAGSITEVRIA